MTLTLRPMTLDDVPRVVEIDAQAFSSPWSARSYVYEVSESNHSHMLTLHRQSPPLRGWRRWLSLARQAVAPSAEGEIIGYGGLWHIADEAHISTIAVANGWRGKGYGELLLASMLWRSCQLDAAYVVLEVRVSNVTAQNLYDKYGFKRVAVKKNYYRDDGEDAYDMRLDLTPAVCEHLKTGYTALLAKTCAHDVYTGGV